MTRVRGRPRTGGTAPETAMKREAALRGRFDLYQRQGNDPGLLGWDGPRNGEGAVGWAFSTNGIMGT